MTKPVLLIDLDTPCFAASAVCEDRSVKVTHSPTGKQKIFKTRTEFKERLAEKGILDKQDEYTFEDIQEPEPIENACQVLKSMLKNFQSTLDVEEVEFFISGKENFRDSLPLPSKYKGNRSSMIRPLLLSDVKKFAISKYKPSVCNFEEPDDAVIYRGYDLLHKGYKPIVVSVDKDCLAYSGLFVFNQDKPEKGILEIPKLGSLWIDDKNKVRGNGFLWYCLQISVGDRTDGFHPTEIAGVKFGEKSAYKLLSGCKSEEEALNVCIDLYKKWYPEPVTYKAWDGTEYTKDYKEIMQMYHRCCRMKETEFDELDLNEFCARYGVTL